jgi:hypothetical protein
MNENGGRHHSHHDGVEPEERAGLVHVRREGHEVRVRPVHRRGRAVIRHYDFLFAIGIPHIIENC